MKVKNKPSCLHLAFNEPEPNLFEVSVLALLPVHHVVEDRDHDVPNLHLRDERHSQERADHAGDEVDLILTCNQKQVQAV